MPYFKESNILYIHIPKTAGIYISDLLGLDVHRSYPNFSPLEPILNNKNRTFFRVVKSFVKQKITRSLIPNFEYLVGDHTVNLTVQNLTVNELIRFGYLSFDEFCLSKKIVSVRHPLDRFISLCSYWKILESGYSIDWVIQNILHGKNKVVPSVVRSTFYPMHSFISDPWSSKPDWFILRQEHLDDDLELLFNEFNINAGKKNKPLNVSSGQRAILTDNQIDTICNYYQIDFEYFNYEFNK